MSRAPHPLETQRTPWLERAFVAALPLALALWYLASAIGTEGRLGFPMDDPYIHFQFARNISHGAGFSFNPGEPTPGATSPLWCILLAAGHLLGAPLEPLAIALGILSAMAAAVLTFEVGIAGGLPMPLALCASVGFAASGRWTWASLSGMETCLAAVLSLAVMWVVLSPQDHGLRPVLLGVLTGLAAEARPEMILLGPLVGVIEWRRRRSSRALLLFAGSVLVVLIPYLLFCLATSGRPLPNTFYAKSLIPLGQAGTELNTLRAEYLPEMLRWAWRDNRIIGALLIPGLLLWPSRRATRGASIIALWPLAFWIYALLLYPRHFSLSRYTIPLMPALALIAMTPIEWLVHRFRGRAAHAWSYGIVGVLALLGAMVNQPRFRAVYLANVDNILRMQVAMGDWVASHLPPGARVATNDVGAITYYGQRYCIDTVGLVSSDFITHELEWEKSHGAVDAEDALPSYWARTRPDYCILFPSWYPNLTRAGWLRKIHEIDYPNNTGGGDELVVYQVTGSPAAGRQGVSPR